MEREDGCKNSPIWLIGDSPPKNWKDDLRVPFDPRHPARHNIWTPIVDGIQERVYEHGQRRFDASRLYVRNALPSYNCKNEAKGRDWSGLEAETGELCRLLCKHKPTLVFTFGSFVFEFVRRSRREGPTRAYSHWSTKNLGKEFRRRVGCFDSDKINVIPLLHVSIARRHFLKSHHYFTHDKDGIYFDYVADKISDLLLNRMSGSDIWVGRGQS